MTAPHADLPDDFTPDQFGAALRGMAQSMTHIAKQIDREPLAVINHRLTAIEDALDAIGRQLAAIYRKETKIMALNQDVADALATLSSDLDAFIASHGDTAGLVQQLSDANAALAVAQANDATDAATIADLQAAKDAAQAAFDANQQGILDSVNALDAKVKVVAPPV